VVFDEEKSPPGKAKGHYSMKQPPDFAPGAEFIDAPRDPDLRALHRLWLAKRGNRQLPSRVDFDPSEFKNLLQDFFVYNVDPTEGSFTVRLIGERLRDFIGSNVRGKLAGSAFQPEGTTALVRILDLTVKRRVPIFRVGRAYFLRDKSYQQFEACLLPVSADGESVNMILGAVRVSS
jgi:hypothetical protein